MEAASAVLKMYGAVGSVTSSATEAAAAVEHEDLVLEDQLLGSCDGGGRVAAVVLAHQRDLAAVHAAGLVDLVVDDLGAVHDQAAVEITRPREGAQRADLDLVGGDARRALGRGRRRRCGDDERDHDHEDDVYSTHCGDLRGL